MTESPFITVTGKVITFKGENTTFLKQQKISNLEIKPALTVSLNY